MRHFLRSKYSHWVLIFAFGLFTSTVFINCTGAGINFGEVLQSLNNDESEAPSGQGSTGGYDGKPIFDLIVPDWTCEGKPSPYASIEVLADYAILTVNAVEKCARQVEGILLKDLITSTVNPELIAYRGSIFKIRSSTGVMDLSSIILAWCRSSAPDYDVYVAQSGALMSAKLQRLNESNAYTPVSQSGAPGITNYLGSGFDLSVSTSPLTANLQATVSWDPNPLIISNMACIGQTPPVLGTQPENWKLGLRTGAPSPRSQAKLFWTGSKLLSWSGRDLITSAFLSDGALYDPVTDNWTPMNTAGMPPQSGSSQTGIWTGSHMIVWGGTSAASTTGGIFNPTLNSWAPISQVNEPPRRQKHLALWTGSKMIVWGGESGTFVPLNDGALYDPNLDTWTTISTTQAPSPRMLAATVWTGSKMIVWGGSTGPMSGGLNTGGIYDPVTDTWQSMPTLNAPSPRVQPLIGVMGNKIIIWGGTDFGWYVGLNDGAIYDLTTSSWTPMDRTNAPDMRFSFEAPMAVWTGAKIIAVSSRSMYGDWASYDPILNRWTRVIFPPTPILGEYSKVVWTGSQAMFWGGNIPNPAATHNLPIILTPFK